MRLVLLFFILTSCFDNDTLSQIKYRDIELIKVSIQGHVNKPGIYTIKKNQRVNDIILKAGGYKSNAERLENTTITNDKEYFVNSNRIKNKININIASNKELSQLKGVGDKLANKIIEYRIKKKYFKSILEIMNVKGIKEKMFNRIYEYITV